jgi:hypothetical protein
MKFNSLGNTVNQRLAFAMNSVISSAKTCCNTLLHEHFISSCSALKLTWNGKISALINSYMASFPTDEGPLRGILLSACFRPRSDGRS